MKQWNEACPAGPPVPDGEACDDCDSILLVDLGRGQTAVVSCLIDAASSAAMKLASLGILPGVQLTLLQRRPAHVIQIGYTELALDAALAARVRVRIETS